MSQQPYSPIKINDEMPIMENNKSREVPLYKHCFVFWCCNQLAWFIQGFIFCIGMIILFFVLNHYMQKEFSALIVSSISLAVLGFIRMRFLPDLHEPREVYTTIVDIFLILLSFFTIWLWIGFFFVYLPGFTKNVSDAFGIGVVAVFMIVGGILFIATGIFLCILTIYNQWKLFMSQGGYREYNSMTNE